MWRYLSAVVLPVLLIFILWIRFGPFDEWAHLVGINMLHITAGLIAV